MKSEKWKKAWRYIGILRLCARRGIWLRRWQRRFIRGDLPALPPWTEKNRRAINNAVLLRALMFDPEEPATLYWILRYDQGYQHSRRGDQWTLHRYAQMQLQFEDMGYSVHQIDYDRAQRILAMGYYGIDRRNDKHE